MMRYLLSLAIACCFLSTTAFAAEEHQDHRLPADIKQYLQHLDSEERDQYQKPRQVIDALNLKPGLAVADLGSGSGYFTRRFIEAVTETGKVYAVDIEPEMLKYAEESVVHMHRSYTAEFILARPDNPKLPYESVNLTFCLQHLSPPGRAHEILLRRQVVAETRWPRRHHRLLPRRTVRRAWFSETPPGPSGNRDCGTDRGWV